jgi:hypothetical protein
MRTRNPEKRSLQRSRYRRRAITELRDCYIKNLLCKGTQLKRRDITQELIQIKREELKSYRQLKPLKPHRQPEELDLYRQLKALVPCGFRVCIGCLLTLPIDSFYMQGGIHKESGRVTSRCKSCYNKQCLERRKCNPRAKEIQKLAKRRWVTDNKERHIEQNRKHQKAFWRRAVTELRDCYIKELICDGTSLKPKDIPRELVELKRMHLKFHRQLKKIQQ